MINYLVDETRLGGAEINEVGWDEMLLSADETLEEFSPSGVGLDQMGCDGETGQDVTDRTARRDKEETRRDDPRRDDPRRD